MRDGQDLAEQLAACLSNENECMRKDALALEVMKANSGAVGRAFELLTKYI